ncbi:thiamine transporter 2 isoform X2 [Drosophila pseudoobscura]|uniref:Thiamine transporter 2 isoform X2 n=1 Tax=Drosophila pseudoobscura pseudoobscura TaxID=46245 RepID=A0A6I8URU7_DROPS|nr:thiamine transporter 2 isoform X2 [Drosophila pseudoobscura]
MESWLKISWVLCIFGFLREIRPSEPYHAEILMSDWYHVTQEEINRSVYPVGTYSYLALQIFVFLITDFLRYKPVIIANALTGILVWSTLLWTTTLTGLQVVEVFYGFYQAAEVAYYAYIYAKVDKKYYPLVTSYTRSAMFVGKLVGGLLAQLMIGMHWMVYRQLYIISITSQVLALFWSFGLPKVEKSLYFHSQSGAGKDDTKSDAAVIENGSQKPEETVEKPSPATKQSFHAFQLLWTHFHSAYTNPTVLQWSLWYAMILAGFLQISTYMQVVWKSYDEPTIAWNGAVDAALTALSAVFSLLAGYFPASRLKTRTSFLTIAVLSVLQGGCILLSSWTSNIYYSYLGYVLFGGLFAFTITVASSELASSLVEDSFALVFGFNTFIALLLQCILTFVVVSENVNLNLNVFEQFTVYAFYFMVIGIVYFTVVVLQCVWSGVKGPKTNKEVVN